MTLSRTFLRKMSSAATIYLWSSYWGEVCNSSRSRRSLGSRATLSLLCLTAMQNALVNLDIETEYKQALQEMGYNLEDLYEFEHDPALGNGGLGTQSVICTKPYE